MKQLQRGMLISVEGIDGSGKSTLLQNLVRSLVNHQLPVIQTKEPGATALGKQLRTLLQERTFTIHPHAEYLLFAADRAQHFQELIIPQLHNNNIIISDRMADSSLVYQGFGRGLDAALLTTVNTWAMHGIKPDLTIYVRISPTVAFERLQRRTTLTAFEQEKEAFFVQLVKGFDTIFNNRSDVITLDGTQSREQLTTIATDAVLSWLTAHAGLQQAHTTVQSTSHTNP